VAQAVVDVLETVQVDEEQRKGLAAAARARQRALEPEL
jgi:hypothetical protein